MHASSIEQHHDTAFSPATRPPLWVRLEHCGAFDAALIAIALVQWALLTHYPRAQYKFPHLWLMLPVLSTWTLLALGAIAPLARRPVPERMQRQTELPPGSGLWLTAYGLMTLVWLFCLFNIDPDFFWGFWHLARMKTVQFNWVASLLPLALAPGWRRLGRRGRLAWIYRRRRLRRRPMRTRRAWVGWLTAFALVAAVAWALRDRQPMSDGWGMIGMSQGRSPLSVDSYREPLSMLLLREGHHLLRRVGMHPGQSLGLIVFTVSIGTLALMAWLMNLWRWTGRQKAMGWLLVGSSLGLTQMLLGRIELYAFVQLGMVATVVFGLAAIEGRAPIALMALSFALALALHLSAIFILPAVLWIVWLWAKGENRSVARGLAQLALWMALIHVPLWTALMLKLDVATPVHLIQAMMRSLDTGAEGLTFIGSNQPTWLGLFGQICSPSNLFKMVQILFYLSGGAALTGLLILLGRRQGSVRHSVAANRIWRREMSVLWAAWIGYAIYALTWHADWTWTEDWDLFSGLAPLTVLLVMRWLMPAPGAWRISPRFACQVCLFALALSLTQNVYHHRYVSFIDVNGKISCDAEYGSIYRSYQLIHGWTRGEYFHQKDGCVFLYMPGESPIMIYPKQDASGQQDSNP